MEHHRRLKLNGKLAHLDTEICNDIKTIGQPDEMFIIMGDWSGQAQKYHEPIRGRGMRTMLSATSSGYY
jgi:hypothetical protein